MVSRCRRHQLWTDCLCLLVLLIIVKWPMHKVTALSLESLLLAPVVRFSRISDGSHNEFERLRSALFSHTPYSDEVELSAEDEEMIELGRDKLQPFFDFPLDDWQLQAGGAVLQGHNVIVSAPTGAGKTVPGEMALHTAYTLQQKKAIYTTPLKALSNQKYADLCPIFGKENVGLSTGDISINKGAPVTVMTTEVYRNIAWRASSHPKNAGKLEGGIIRRKSEWQQNDLSQNAVVVLDEFHYMGHPGRGGVWEESVITSPSHTQIVGLSATLPNAPQLASWMEHVTSRKTVLVNISGTRPRPVPLRYLFATKEGIFPLFRDPEAGPGAPKGLLGLRGDGFCRNWREKESGEKERVKLPRGLQVNPQLKRAAEKRLQKVNRAIERKKIQQVQQSYLSDGDDWSPRSRNTRTKRMSGRDEKRERERLLRQELRRSVPSLPMLLMRLKSKQLLPAIFFLFSRAGCDEAARNACNFMKGPTRDPLSAIVDDDVPRRKKNTRERGRRRWEGNSREDDIMEDPEGRMFRKTSKYVNDDILEASFTSIFEDDNSFNEEDPLNRKNLANYAKSGLLTHSEVVTVAAKVESFNEDNPEIAFPNDIIIQYLFGVGSHHAGMLPAHKSFVEILYRNQLMKAVFATETLAAGINMPARTTVICALAKRGDGSSMNLLETSNLLQMAGRAGRRSFDESGYCVIVATPFETHEDAVAILTDPVKPITSQFSPSYSLAINLVARGAGKLDVAKQLVGKSFALWEKQQIESDLAAAVESHGEGMSEILEASAHERFMITLVESLQAQVDKKRAKFQISYVEYLLGVLQDRESLKKASKSFLSATKMLELEQNTIGYLQAELTAYQKSTQEEDEILQSIFEEDQEEIEKQVELQRARVAQIEKDINKHPFTAIADIANQLMQDSSSKEGNALLGDLRVVRSLESGQQENDDGATEMAGASAISNHSLSQKDLCRFSKSAVVIRRKTRKLESANPGLDASALLKQADKVEEASSDTWDDMLAIIKVLVAYGCLSTRSQLDEHNNFSLEQETFEINPAGNNIGMLGFENSLWCLTAMGGAWDVIGASSKLDDFRNAIELGDSGANDNTDWFDEDLMPSMPASSTTKMSRAREEAHDLVSLIRSMTPSQLAGYVSCLISEGSRGGGVSVVEIFQSMESEQQRVIQTSLQVMERLMEVQKECNVDENTRICNFDVSNCQVVTAWSSGCTWNEALEISGSPPGDLARTLSRVLDAVRQLGNLPFRALRKEDVLKEDHQTGTVSLGLHPEIRSLCRDAARAINRYPVKDPLQFAEIADEDEIEDELNDEDEIEDMLNTTRTF